jgi:hypothetical protein
MKDPCSALARGHQIRIGRAALKLCFGEGTLCPLDFLADPPEALHTLPVGRFLDWLPWIGAARVRALVRGIPDVDEHTAIGQLDADARAQLIERLRPRFGSVAA